MPLNDDGGYASRRSASRMRAAPGSRRPPHPSRTRSRPACARDCTGSSLAPCGRRRRTRLCQSCPESARQNAGRLRPPPRRGRSARLGKSANSASSACRSYRTHPSRPRSARAARPSSRARACPAPAHCGSPGLDRDRATPSPQGRAPRSAPDRSAPTPRRTACAQRSGTPLHWQKAGPAPSASLFSSRSVHLRACAKRGAFDKSSRETNALAASRCAMRPQGRARTVRDGAADRATHRRTAAAHSPAAAAALPRSR